MKRLSSAAALTLTAVALTIALAACGGGGAKSSAKSRAPTGARAADARGAKIFEDAGCGSCHTLVAAGSKGTVGPNLDQLAPNRETVVRQVKNGSGAMPSFAAKLTGAQIQAVAAFVSDSTSSEQVKRVIGFKPDHTKLSDCRSGDAACYMQAFGNLAYDEGPKVALDQFSKAIQTTPAVERVCHPIAHAIGAASLLHFKGDVGKAFADGNAVCGSGYYHGLLQWKLAGVPEGRVAAVARTVCASVRQRSSFFVYYQCVHGLGHGLMLYTRDDLPAALRLCHRLIDNFDRVSCTGGVFMENQQPSFGGASKWLQPKNLLYPCNIVSRFDKTYCYLMVTSQILPRDGWDWKRTAAWCRRSDPGFTALCFQSFGRDASGTSRQNPVGIRNTCAEAGSGEKECLFGAVRDILNNQPGDPRAKELCDTVGAADRSYCFFGIGTMIGTQYGTPSAREGACRTFAKGNDFDDCVKGAVSAAQQSA